MAQPEDRKLGCIVPDKEEPAIEFSTIRLLSGQSLPHPMATERPNIPDTVNYLNNFGSWDVLGNNKYNNCVAVTWANMRRLVTSKLGRQETYPSFDKVMEFYRTQNPNPGQDDGMRLYYALKHLVDHGGPDGQKAVAFAAIRPINTENVRFALATFGYLALGIKVTNWNGMESKLFKKLTPPWELLKDNYGHAILAGGYTPDVNVVTWGKVMELDNEYWRRHEGLKDVEQAIFEAYVVIWPEHIGTRRFMTGVNLTQLVNEYQSLTGSTLHLPDAQLNPLYFIPYAQNNGERLTIKRVDQSNSYTTITKEATIPLTQDENWDGHFCIDDGDLYYIKTRNTGSNSIEVHRMPGTDHGRFDLQHGSRFPLEDAHDGYFTVDNGDLYYIKTRNTGSGMVEIHYATHQSRFDHVEHYATGLKFEDVGYGVYTVRGGDLYAILDAHSSSGYVEVYCAKANARYSAESVTKTITGFKLKDIAGEGVWDIGRRGDLHLIKTRKTASKMVELHAATAESGYRTTKHYSTAFKADNKRGGYYRGSVIPNETIGIWMV